MLFNFGKSNTSSQSSSLGLGYGYNGSTSVSNDVSQSQSQQSSQQGSQQTSTQSLAFSPLYQALFQNAGGAAANAADLVPTLQGQAGQLFSGGVGFLDQLQAPSDAESAQLDALQSGLGALFRDQLNPAITDAGVATGTLGGGRQGVAQGVAAGQIAQQYQQGAAQIMANARGQNIQAAATGLGALPSLFGLAQGGANAGLAPYLSLAQIMGGPAVLTQSQGTSFGQSEGESTANAIAQAISKQFGENFSYDTSQSSSSGKSFNFGLGVK